MTRTAACLVTLVLLSHPALSSSTSRPDHNEAATELLGCWGNALGGSTRLGGIESLYREGTIETGGLKGTIRTWNRSDGAYRIETNVGPYRNVEVFDGERAWTRDSGSRSHELGGPELRRAITDAYLDSFSPFLRGRMKGSARRGERADSLVLTAAGGDSVTVLLDPETCLPRRITRPETDRVSTVSYITWTTTDGLQLPAKVIQSYGDSKYDVHVTFEDTTLNRPIPSTLLTPDEGHAKVRLPGGEAEIAIPFTLNENHIYLPVMIDGKGPSAFALDTGADVTVIAADHAKELGLEPEGVIEARGAGEGSMDAAVIANPTLTIGKLEMPLDAVFTIPLGRISLREGRPMEGILGYNVLGHFVVEIDYANNVIRLHDPAKFTAPSDTVAVPLSFEGNIPAVRGAIELADGKRIEGRMTLDTGSRGAITIASPFVDKYRLLDGAGKTIDAPLGLGVGGETRQNVGRISALQLGPFAIRSPITSFSRDTKGSHANPDIAANIGGEILRRFDLFVDYPNERILLRPNRNFDQPFEYDMSGALIEAADETYRRKVVKSVLPSSPASEAGIRPGDEIIAIDGAPADGKTLQSIRSMFRTPGQEYVLTLRRGDETLVVPLTTRRLV